MMMVKQLLGTDTSSATLAQQHHEARVRIRQGQEKQRHLQQEEQSLQLRRAELIEEHETEGTDVTKRLQSVDGKLSRVQRELADLGPQLIVRERRADELLHQLRAAETREAPGKMQELTKRHTEQRDTFRTMVMDLQTLAGAIIRTESDIEQLSQQYGISRDGVHLIEGVADPARQATAAWLERLEWQDQQIERGDELGRKIEADHAEAERRNEEAGVPGLWKAPAYDYFRSGLIDETEEQRDARLHG
jgi:chromosome segregation ATPase